MNNHNVSQQMHQIYTNKQPYSSQLDHHQQHQQSSILKQHKSKVTKRLSKKVQVNQDNKQLTNIFYQLICLVNKHSKVLQLNNQLAYPVISASSQYQSISRHQYKKRAIKPPKFFQDLPQPNRQVVHSKTNLQRRQTVQISHQPLKKSLNHIEIIHHKNFGTLSQLVSWKRNVFGSYNQVMNYKLNFADDISTPIVVQNNSKIRILQSNFSQISLVNSQKQRKFSIQKCIQISIPKQKPFLQFYNLPQIEILKVDEKLPPIIKQTWSKEQVFNQVQQDNTIQN